jgi:flagellin
MGFRINTNIAAMNAHTNSTMNNRNLDGSLAKLSSGLRINTAADDASGLVIANSLRSQANSLGQAVSNGNDAIGLIQTADGALSEYSKILDTIKTKSIQAGSDGQNTASRLAIQKDIGRLMEELNTIAKTTSFNGQKLLSGTFVNKEFQMGANANESVKSSIASAETSQIGQTTRADLTISDVGENQLTLKSATTGKEITLEAFNIQANNNPENGMGKVADLINKYSGETGITAKAVVETTSGTIAAGTTGADFAINGVNIGAINVTANDADSTLLTAINNKTTETGVAATKTADGKLTLTSTDGRAINVTGDMAEMGKTAAEMSTIGKLEVVQAGSSTFQITGAALKGTTAGADIDLTGTMAIIEDSVLEKTSVIGTGSILIDGTKLGTLITATTGMSFVVGSSSADMTLGKDSKVLLSSIINKDTELSTDFIVNANSTLALSSSMLVAAGSILTTGTKFDAGTVLTQDIISSGETYKAGTVLGTDLTLTASVTLTKDMVMFVDLAGTANAAIGSSSVLAAGTVLGLDITTTSTGTDTALKADMVFKAGSVLVSGSEMAKGTVLGETITITAEAITTSGDMILKAGSSLGSGSTIDEGSTIGGLATLGGNMTLTKDMTLKEGSLIASGSTLKKGTVLTQDLTADQVNSGTGLGLKAGEVLNVDLVTTADIRLTKSMDLLKESILLGNSQIAANAGTSNSVTMSNESFTNLSNIDVTTLKGAMAAIDTVSAAITNLDTIRSDLGSVQNQIVSTINNISVTQVNVKAAESNIRDVDFAAESANFSKFNILAQSGSYAMSQANAVQQNVLRLLQ